MTDPLTVSKAGAGIAGWFSGMAMVPILGLPAGGFIAALVASALNNTNEVVPGRSVPARLMRVIFDALVGGWLAMALIKLPTFRDYGVADLGFTIAAALITLCVPWIRDNGKKMATDTWAIIRDRLKGKSGGTQ